MNERPAAPAELATSNDIQPGPFSEHELREAWNLQADPFNQWDSLDTCEQLAWAQARAIAADRAGYSTPARLRHCSTHGHQPPEAWGCPECVRELRKELKALRAAIAAERASRPAPVEPADDGPSIEQLGPLISWLTEQCNQAANAGRSTDAGMLLWAAQVAGERVDEDALDSTPPAEGELVDLARCVEAWAARLDEGLSEERLLGRVAYVLRQRQAPPHEGEVDALIKILSRIARMLDFIFDGPPNGQVIHRAIELLRQLTPPAEGEVGELAAALQLRAAQNPLGTADLVITRAAALLQQQEAELTQCREALRRVRLQQRIPGGGW